MDNSTLSAEEQAYFDSRGETAPPVVEKEPAPAQEAPEEIEAADDAEPDVGTADDGDDVEEQPRQSMVPHKALHAEREKRKALERELQEAKEFRIRFEERQRYLAELDAQRQAKPEEKPAPVEVPDPDEDVFAATRHALTKTQELERRLEEQAKAQQAAEFQRQAAARLEASEAEFRKTAPDYDDAMKHLMEKREQEYILSGFKDPMQRRTMLQREAFGMIQRAAEIGMPPAQYAYEIAKTRGWQPKVLQASEDGEERIERAKTASRSLSGVGGSPSGAMTGERLLAMSTKEFAEYERKNPATVRRLLSGG